MDTEANTRAKKPQLVSQHAPSQYPKMEASPDQFSAAKSYETTPTLVPVERGGAGQETPYLERHIPQSTSSQPEDAWPLIDEDHHHKEVPLVVATCAGIPSPQNTMLYAAVMTNRSHRDEPHPPMTSSSVAASSSSAYPVDQAHFSHASYASGSMRGVTSPPLNPQAGSFFMSARPMPQSEVIPGLALNTTSLLNTSLPTTTPYPIRVTTAPVTTTNTGTSSSLPFQLPRVPSMPVYGYAGHRMAGSVSGVYSSPSLTKVAGNTTPHQQQQGYRPSTSAALPLAPYSSCTVAAAMEVRNMLGIDSGRQSSSPVVYNTVSTTRPSVFNTTSRTSFQVSGYPPPPPPAPAPATAPATREQATQTPVSSCRAKAVQATGGKVVSCAVQTQAPRSSNVETQTSGCYVPVDSLSPPEQLQVNSIGTLVRQALPLATSPRFKS